MSGNCSSAVAGKPTPAIADSSARQAREANGGDICAAADRY